MFLLCLLFNLLNVRLIIITIVASQSVRVGGFYSNTIDDASDKTCLGRGGNWFPPCHSDGALEVRVVDHPRWRTSAQKNQSRCLMLGLVWTEPQWWYQEETKTDESWPSIENSPSLERLFFGEKLVLVVPFCETSIAIFCFSLESIFNLQHRPHAETHCWLIVCTILVSCMQLCNRLDCFLCAKDIAAGLKIRSAEQRDINRIPHSFLSILVWSLIMPCERCMPTFIPNQKARGTRNQRWLVKVT